MDTIHNTWPPAYNLRISRKARHAHLKVIPNQGLEVVIPIRLQKKIEIADLLAEKRAWIQKHLAKLTIQPLTHITELKLHAIDKTWTIEYKSTQIESIKGMVSNEIAQHLILYGNVANIALANKWISQWLKMTAREHLVPWLDILSIENNLPYNEARIRAQNTLWGSCNSSKNISLNYKLLFIPKAQARHILLHELCHTKYLNHSKRFWDLLKRLDPDTELHNSEIREADKFVPYGL